MQTEVLNLITLTFLSHRDLTCFQLIAKKPKRLAESTTEVSATDNSTSNDTAPEANRAALAKYDTIDVDLQPNPQLIHTGSPVISPRLIQPMG
ncbi:hypothetical protein EG68_11878 [Paragonimus skrjabini miyazakii]|uniref:Uncharacterized protein n=1 Tax=Paragonimus skrjabini miyazakii TaxID=59628 RepID=A0A8S9YJF8_9TREM|nr:hypothetical protein EG68_11878 [Paragonimus skrjabini miyazakii]